MAGYDALREQEREAFLTTMRKKLNRISVEMLAELMAAEYRYLYGNAFGSSDLSNETDICIYVLSRQSGEAKDRKNEEYILSDAERAHLTARNAHYKHMVRIVNAGASLFR